MEYDYEEGYFARQKKLDYWKAKKVFDGKYLVPLVDRDKHTLNAGCGLFVEKDTLNLKDIVCSDISKAVLAKLSAQGLQTVRADLKGRWPFKDGEFEQVLLLDVMEHLGHIDNFLMELYRVTGAGGKAVLGIPLLNHWRSRLRLLLGTTIGVQYDEHPRMFFDADVRSFFSRAGFVLEKAVYIGMTKGYGYYRFRKP